MQKEEVEIMLEPQTFVEKVDMYQTLVSRRQNIENIFWNRIQTLHVIQAAVLGGGYFLVKREGETVLSVALLLIGMLLTALLGRLACNDWHDAKIDDDKMHKLGDELGIKRTAKRDCLKSHSILLFVIVLFLAIDTVFIFWLIVKGMNSVS